MPRQEKLEEDIREFSGTQAEAMKEMRSSMHELHEELARLLDRTSPDRQSVGELFQPFAGLNPLLYNEYTQPARDSPIANTFWSLLFDDGHAPTLADTDQLEQAAENMVKSFPPCCLCGEDAKGDEWFSQNCRWPRGVNSTDEEPVLKLARSIVYATYPGQCPVTNSTPAEEVNLTVVVDSRLSTTAPTPGPLSGKNSLLPSTAPSRASSHCGRSSVALQKTEAGGAPSGMWV